MPVEIQVIRASEFVRVDPDDNLDFGASKKALEVLALACRKRGLDRAVIDLRKWPVLRKPRFTTKELAALVSTFREAGLPRRQRLAVLYRHDVYGGVRTFAFFSRMRGLDVQAFTDFEGAMQWLSEGQESAVESGGDGAPVAITRPKIEAKKPAMRVATEGRCRTVPRSLHNSTRHTVTRAHT